MARGKAKEKSIITPQEKEIVETFVFGDVSLPLLYQDAEYVPASAHSVIMNKQDEKSIAIGLQKDLPILLMGEAGTGKTSIARYIAYKRKQGYVRINMHGYATPDELIGSKSVKEGRTYYEHGILTNAMIRGHLVVLDEVNATPPDCLFILHGLLDEDKRITLPNGDIIKPHPDFRFFATMNPDYEGTKSLNRAFIDRFSIILNIETVPASIESRLITDRTSIADTVANSMVSLALMARKNYYEQKTITFVSTRSLLQWATLAACGMNLERAYTVSIANKVREEERKAFMDFFYATYKKDPSTADYVEKDPSIIRLKSEWERLANQVQMIKKDYDDQVALNISMLKQRDELKKETIRLKELELDTKNILILKKENKNLKARLTQMSEVLKIPLTDDNSESTIS